MAVKLIEVHLNSDLRLRVRGWQDSSYYHVTFSMSHSSLLSKCASVAARYELRDVFDNVIISLCKFSTLLNMPEVKVVSLSGPKKTNFFEKAGE